MALPSIYQLTSAEALGEEHLYPFLKTTNTQTYIWQNLPTPSAPLDPLYTEPDLLSYHTEQDKDLVVKKKAPPESYDLPFPILNNVKQFINWLFPNNVVFKEKRDGVKTLEDLSESGIKRMEHTWRICSTEIKIIDNYIKSIKEIQTKEERELERLPCLLLNDLQDCIQELQEFKGDFEKMIEIICEHITSPQDPPNPLLQKYGFLTQAIDLSFMNLCDETNGGKASEHVFKMKDDSINLSSVFSHFYQSILNILIKSLHVPLDKKISQKYPRVAQCEELLIRKETYKKQIRELETQNSQQRVKCDNLEKLLKAWRNLIALDQEKKKIMQELETLNID